MGSLCTKFVNNSANIDVLDYTPKDDSYEYLRPRGQIIVQIDEKYKVPVVILDFNECVTKFIRLWPYGSVQRNEFLDLEKTPLSSPNMPSSSGYSSSYDTVF